MSIRSDSSDLQSAERRPMIVSKGWFQAVALVGLCAGLFGAVAQTGIRQMTTTEPTTELRCEKHNTPTQLTCAQCGKPSVRRRCTVVGCSVTGPP